MIEIKNRIISNFPLAIQDDKIFNTQVEAEANSIKSLKDYSTEYTGNVDVYQQNGEMLDKTISFFSFLEKLSGESEDGLKNRFRALFVRNNISPWGTSYSIKNVFKQYFKYANIFIQENTRDESENLIVDGNFEEGSSSWNFNNSSLTSVDKFAGQNSVLLNSGSELSQIVHLEDIGCYTVHFFMKGELNLRIKNSNNQYWDFDNLVWDNNLKEKKFNCDNWNNQSCFFLTDVSTDITLSFNGIQGTFLDYISLFKKKKNATFTVVCQFEGVTADGALILAPGSDDPVNDKIDRSMYGFYDHTHFTGIKTGFAKDIYNDLLQYLKPVGVQAFLNILVKEQ